MQVSPVLKRAHIRERAHSTFLQFIGSLDRYLNCSKIELFKPAQIDGIKDDDDDSHAQNNKTT